MKCRRTYHLERDFVDLVLASIERGDMTPDRAAQIMTEHRIPAAVVTRITEAALRDAPLPTIEALAPFFLADPVTTGDAS